MATERKTTEQTNPKSELDDFLADILPRQIKAETAVHNGDATLRLEMWSKKDPLTIFGAFGPCVIGLEETTRVSRWAASRFSNCIEYRFELVAAEMSGDMAYTVGYEHSKRSVDGGPIEPSTLRVTHIYRREDGEWKVVHRHADFMPVDESLPPEAPKE